MKNLIPENIALEICELIRKRNDLKKASFAKIQCWGCMKYSNNKKDVRVRCLYSDPNLNNRGCKLINEVYDNEYNPSFVQK
jgi:hypothetical protein